MTLFISLSETDKRVLFAVLLVFILLIVLVGYIGFIINKVMKRQAKHIENAVHDVVVTNVVTDAKSFRKYAYKKNLNLFYKTTKIPMLIILSSLLILLINDLIMQNFAYNPFNMENGFGSLLFIWDFTKSSSSTNIWFITINWPTLIHTPTYVAQAWGGYLFTLCFTVGTIWYMISIQGFIARALKIRKLSKSIYDKSLENFNQSAAMYSSFQNYGQNNNRTQNERDYNSPNNNNSIY